MKKSKFYMVLALLLTSLLIFTGCAGGDKADDNTIVVGSKNYTENILLGEIMAQLIEAKTDLNVERKFNLGGTLVCFQALKKGDLDLYPDYTGTGLLAILKKPVETDPDKVYNIVQEEYNKKYNIKWLKPLGFNNTYTIAVRDETAQKYGLETYSDLAKVSNQLVFGTDQEFINRKDGLKGLKETYNMEFADEKAMEIALRYQAIAKKNTDVTNAYATDGELVKYKLKVLKDDKQFFPPYYCAPTVNMNTLENYPQLEDILNTLGGQITDHEMQQLNFKAAVENMPKEDIAKEFLQEKGLI